MTGSVRRRRLRAVVLAGLVGWPSAAAAAQPAVLAWSTYLRAGPGQSFAAIAELEHDTPLAVGPCVGDWCHVSGAHADGFVDRDSLTLPRTPAPRPSVQTDCVTALQADDRKPIATRFCSTPAAR